MENITFAPKFWHKINAAADICHLLIIATKPDIIKQAPLYHALRDAEQSVFIIHTGQHYDFNLSGAMLEEFGLPVSANLGVEGSPQAKFGQIVARLGEMIAEMQQLGKTVIPWVHGDTMTASAAAIAGYLQQVAAVHVEAGLRTLTPKKALYEELLQRFDDSPQAAVKWWRALHADTNNFERGSWEPWPEQCNTKIAEVNSGVHLAATEINRQLMLTEGIEDQRIFVVGNSVVDATAEAINDAKQSEIFVKYPQLANGFVRYCIHRQENCGNETRFRAIWQALRQTLAEGETVLLITLHQTKAALKNYELEDDFAQLRETYPDTFIASDVWPYYSDVIAAMSRAKLCVTDSGSMQEEMNEMQIPCVTLRFGSDRGESFFAGGNITAPPLDGALIAGIVREMLDNQPAKIQKIYGTQVSQKCVKAVVGVLTNNQDLFLSEEERIFGGVVPKEAEQ